MPEYRLGCVSSLLQDICYRCALVLGCIKDAFADVVSGRISVHTNAPRGCRLHRYLPQCKLISGLSCRHTPLFAGAPPSRRSTSFCPCSSSQVRCRQLLYCKDWHLVPLPLHLSMAWQPACLPNRLAAPQPAGEIATLLGELHKIHTTKGGCWGR